MYICQPMTVFIYVLDIIDGEMMATITTKQEKGYFRKTCGLQFSVLPLVVTVVGEVADDEASSNRRKMKTQDRQSLVKK